ncbi:MAG: aspartate aminotransferase family protein [Sulfolobales archaeon]
MSTPVDEEALKRISAGLEKIYVERTRRSRELFERAYRILPGGVTYTVRFMKPYPPYIERADGTRVWDIDGNEYIDFWMGHGTHILGHRPRLVIDAVLEAMGKATHIGFENPYAVEYAELLSRVVPGLEMVRFANSGTEANMYVLRLARAYTKRKYVIKIEGGWHGGFDPLHVAVTPPFTGPESAGLLEEITRQTIAVPFNDLDAVEQALKKHEVAAIIVEPVLGAGGCIEPLEGYLKGLRDLSHRYESLLIFDEVITGFRLAPGGAQEYFGVRADLVVLGKIVGGGFAGAGAFGGRAEIMELLDHIKYKDPRSRSFHGGTFVGNPINMAAGRAMVRHLSQNRSLYERANNMWSSFRRKVDRVCEEHGNICWTTGAGTMVGIHFTRARPRNSRDVYELRWSKTGEMEYLFHLYSRINGILYVGEKLAHLLPSLIHSEEEIGKLSSLLEELLARVARGSG